MRENEIFAVLFATLRACVPLRAPDGYPIEFAQSYQPSKQGVPETAVVLVRRITARRIGSLKRSSVWDEVNERMVTTEVQQMATTFQCDALAKAPTDNDPDVITASDLVDWAAWALQSELGMRQLRAAGIGIERVTDIRFIPIIDSEDDNESDPQFDFTLTHRDIAVTYTGVVSTIDVDIHRV